MIKGPGLSPHMEAELIRKAERAGLSRWFPELLIRVEDIRNCCYWIARVRWHRSGAASLTWELPDGQYS